MTQPTRWTRRSLLALSGGGMTVAGTLLPWTTITGADSPLVQRGIDTPVGMLITVLGVAMLVTALLRVAGARLMLLVFGWAAAFWMLVATQHERQNPDTVTFGPGWYCAWVGIGLTLVLTMALPLWQHLRHHRMP